MPCTPLEFGILSSYIGLHIYRSELAAGPMGIPAAGLRRASHMQQQMCDHIYSGTPRRVCTRLHNIATIQINTTMSSMILSRPESFETIARLDGCGTTKHTRTLSCRRQWLRLNELRRAKNWNWGNDASLRYFCVCARPSCLPYRA